MSSLVLSGVLLLICLALPSHRPCACLPKDIQPTDVVSTEMRRSAKEPDEVKKITVEQKLKELNARCRRGKLVDSNGKQIYFYRMIGCWGNPPADYQELLKQQDMELENLRKRYHVVEMTCNPSGEQIS
jgi:hypothetical protein